MSSRKDILIEGVYSTPGEPGSYSSFEKLEKALKRKGENVTIPEIRNWLQKNDTYTKHRVARTNFRRNPIIATNIDDQWQGDLADMSNLSQHNDDIKFLLVLIDVVSKYVWVEPLKSKSGPSVQAGFKKIWKRTNRRPHKIQTDDGKEFKYKGVQEMLKKMKIKFFTVKSEKKAAIAERMIRTLKEKIWRYTNKKNTKRYIDVLQDLVASYNSTYHKSIKIAPDQVDENNEGDILQNLYGHLWTKKFKKEMKKRKPKFEVGDHVRISRFKELFRKRYEGNWSEEIFRVKNIKTKSEPRIVYFLEDWSGEPLEGTFYEEELQKVNIDLSNFWKIEKILDIKILRNGKKKYFVKWVGYPDSMNEWIDEENIRSV